MKHLKLLALLTLLLARPPAAWPGPTHKRIVLISGDEEYRSEESLPQLAKILSQRHGFECTVRSPTRRIVSTDWGFTTTSFRRYIRTMRGGYLE
jgi:hypothetical protein